MKVYAVCVSGGLDSTVAYFHYLKATKGSPVLALYVKLGHRYEGMELQALRSISRASDGLFDYSVLDYLRLGDFEWRHDDPRHPAYIPLRNFYLVMVSYNYVAKLFPHAEEVVVVVTGVRGDRSPDKSPEAYEVMTRAINSLLHNYEPRVLVESPFWDMTKGEVVRWFISSYGFSYASRVLRATASCYSPAEVGGRYCMCGSCPACFRRWVALEVNGVSVEGDYVRPPWLWEGAREYLRRAREGVYDERRSSEIVEALRRRGIC